MNSNAPMRTALLTASLALHLLANFEAAAQTTSAQRPFPQHVAYTAGTIKPNHLTQAQLDATTANFYDAWRARYLKQGCGSGRYYVDVSDAGGDAGRNTLTVSEAHGYGMLIVAWMAGRDGSARTQFDGMVRYWKGHQARSGAGLMAWKQVKGCANATLAKDGEDGASTATDGDLDIAYALLLADKQWGSAGAINYRREAVTAIQAILVREVNPITYHLLLGDWTNATAPRNYYGTRPSDFTFDHLRAFQVATNNAQWSSVINTGYSLIARMQTRYSLTTGLLPDFIESINTAAKPAIGKFLEQAASDGKYAYNACRTPWRIAMDYLLYAEPRALAAAGKMNAWIKGRTNGNPRLIVDGYALSGKAFGTDNALAFVAPFGAAAMTSAVHQNWLNSVWTNIAKRTVADSDYYGNTLKMLALIAMSGNAWKP